MVKATKPGLHILQWCSVLASYWVHDVEFKSVIGVWVSVFALKIIRVQLVVSYINATTVFGNEGSAFTFFTFNFLRLKQKNNIFLF